MTTHCDEKLTALLVGELGRDETKAVAAHLRECPECSADLVSVAVGHGSLRAARRAEDILRAVDVSPAAPVARMSRDDLPALQIASPRRRLWIPAAAAVLLVAALTAVGFSTRGQSSPPVSAIASLSRMDAPASAVGTATVRSVGIVQRMDLVTSGLPTPPANHYYEVWLLQPSTLKMMPVGVLSPTGGGSYAVATAIMSQYSAVDVSLQANDGTTAHSATSVLRGTVTPIPV